MIIWLNGAFGSGKSTIGTLLQQKMTPSFIYDPEIIGGFLTANLPESMQLSDFQDYPEWRQWNLHLVKKNCQSVSRSGYCSDDLIPEGVF